MADFQHCRHAFDVHRHHRNAGGNFGRYSGGWRHSGNQGRFPPPGRRSACRYGIEHSGTRGRLFHTKRFRTECRSCGRNRREKPLCGGNGRSYSDHTRSSACYGTGDCLCSASSAGWCRYRAVRNGCRKRHPHTFKGRLSEQHQSDHCGYLHRLRHDPDCSTRILPSVPGLV
ncbi:hypothetical protein D9M69_571110 [compost metagenome]